jgi:hypothetical protein
MADKRTKNKDMIFRAVLIASLIFLIYQFGIRPIFFSGKKTIKADSKYWSELLSEDDSHDYDVIVYGSDPQGIAAAVSSARLGADTLLISEDYDMGGNISRCLIPELEIPLDKDGKKLNGGIMAELSQKVGDYFSPEQYIAAVNELLQAEDNLTVVAGSSAAGVNMSANRIDSVSVRSRDGLTDISARMYIDASDSGTLLDLCGVPYFKGSEDLNLENSYMHVSLNFEMAPSGSAAAGSARKAGRAVFDDGLIRYEPENKRVRFEEPVIYFMPDNRAFIRGLKVAGVDPLDSEEMKKAHEIAAGEAEKLSEYLAQTFVELKDYKLSKTAQSLRVMESKHYKGRYMLTVEDIMDGRYFADTAAMGSHPVMISKLAVRGSYIAGKPDRYSIPLRCLVPDGIQNLLMAGPRISYSSLASSSASAIGTCIAAGEAAGAAAVMCAARNESPMFIEEGYEYFEEFGATLAAKDMYLPDKTISYKFRNNWAYGSFRKLVSLGLLAGGEENDMKADEHAAQKDLAYILMNGIYRLDRGSYTEDLNAHLKPFINDDSLTFDSLMRMLGALYGIEGEPDDVYRKLREQQRINTVFADKLGKLKTNAETITMDMVYYIGAYSIRSFTGKDVSDIVPQYSSACDPGIQDP